MLIPRAGKLALPKNLTLKNFKLPRNLSLAPLIITEWSLAIPLTAQTYDLVYHRIQNDTYDAVFFSYKRLQKKGVCAQDIGIALTRTTYATQPPYDPVNPPVFKQFGSYYFYVAESQFSCYDENDPAQTAAVASVNGGNLRGPVREALQGLAHV